MSKPSPVQPLFLVKQVQLPWLMLLHCPSVFQFLSQYSPGCFGTPANIWSYASFLPVPHKPFPLLPSKTTQLLTQSFAGIRNGSHLGAVSTLGLGILLHIWFFSRSWEVIRTWWVHRNSGRSHGPLIFPELLDFFEGSWSFFFHLCFSVWLFVTVGVVTTHRQCLGQRAKSRLVNKAASFYTFGMLSLVLQIHWLLNYYNRLIGHY